MVHRAVRVWLVLAYCTAALGGCGGPSDATRPDLGRLGVTCDPADAMLFVDDRYVGTVASLKGRAVALPEGLHRVEVRREGYFAHLAEVKVEKGVRRRLRVVLRKQPF